MKHLHPAKILVLGYLFYSVVGCVLLSLPICHKQPVAFSDDYFIAISALSTTGLATIDIGSTYNFFGQLVILLLIQLGGIGYMTFSSFILLCTSGKISQYRKKIGSSSFVFPKDFFIYEFIYSVIIFSTICELIGAIAFSIAFWANGIEEFIWQGIFHAISAFCTAGLSLFSDGFVPFRYNLWLNLIVCVISLLGSLGFIVALDFYKRITGQKESFSFTSKVIFVFTSVFLIGGTLLFLSLEQITDGKTLFKESLIAIFQVTTAMTTTGFNSVDIGKLAPPIIILLAFLSTFGTAPSGTGGGLKNTVFASLLAFVKNTIKGQPTTLWNHEISSQRIKIATVEFIFYVFSLSVTLFFLSITEKTDFLYIFYEAANALNNSGLSMGLTPNLTLIGKMIICLLMLMGRVGVLTFGVAISSQPTKRVPQRKQAELVM